ncbi:MAG: ABC transporter permease, partial [Alphaproteobacteria bacterium]|nr:ABC transporter permease [Alphaproteobacteria bacterium]
QYRRFVTDAYQLRILWDTVALGVETTAVTTVLAYPLAWTFVRAPARWQRLLLFLIALPLLTSAVVRTFAWVVILGRQGIINQALLELGLVGAPLPLLYSHGAVVTALAQIELPLMSLPLITALQRIDPALLDAARSLGGSRWRSFLTVILPLSVPGLIAGAVLVFASSMSAFVTQTLVGGGRMIFMPFHLYQQAIQANDWPFAAALAMILLVAVLLVILGLGLLGRAAMRHRHAG